MKPSDDNIQNVSRREFLSLGIKASLGLTLGLSLPAAAARMGEAAGPGLSGSEAGVGGFAPNAFVRIGTDDSVTVVSKHLEMGQGAYTGMATLVAEELDARWDQVAIVSAPADASRYNNLAWGRAQGTGGSTAIANAYEQMRKAGAAAKAMLVQAAAARWQVPAGEIRVRDGVVSHAKSDRSARFGELAEAAAKLPVPDEVRLKDPKDFRLIGRDVRRKDVADKIDGSAVFTQDIERPGMLTAVVLHPPRFGARLKSFDASAALKQPGVKRVVEIPGGVAVLGTHYWAAKTGRDALKVEWDMSQAMTQGSEAIFADYAQRLDAAGAVARSDGDADGRVAKAGEQVIRADYRVPFLAHAAMEPMNCVVERQADGGVELWYGAQLQTGDQMAVAKVFGIEPAQVRINTLYAGGSFGRRGNPHSDYSVEAAEIVKAIDGAAPVKLVWSREDDMRAGWYRPAYMHRIEAVLGEDGLPVAWRNRIVGQSIMSGTLFAGAIQNGIDPTSVEGAANLPYAIPNLKVELHTTELPVPIQWWRSVGSTHTAFATEVHIDLLARAAGQDPVAYRRALLKDQPRHLGVLDLAVKKSRWGRRLAQGRGRGVAVHESFNSFVAMVAEVSVADDGSYRVDRVDLAVDCGVAVNPDIIRAQMEGGLGFGLAAVLESEITLENGATVQSNFHDYTVLRGSQMPEVRVHILPSTAPPTGVGEPATPVIAPAVANALASVTGRRYLQLPIRAA